MKIETERLILRLPNKKDISDLIEGLNNLKVSGMISKIPYPYTKKDAEWWIYHCIESSKKKADYEFNIELKAEKKLIGGIGLFDINKYNKTAELGTWVAEPYWRRGIISEANICMIDFAFSKLELKRLVWKAFVENEASKGVAKKFGFQYEGTERKSVKAKSTGKIHDVNVYSLLKDEWSKIKKKLR